MTILEVLQYTAWLIALIEFIFALYVLVLNSGHTSNRYVSAILLLLSINTFAIGTLSGAQDANQAYYASILLAATSASILPLLSLTTIALLKPEWLSGRWGWIRWIFITAALIPAVLTMTDVLLGTQFWYTGINPITYHGGFITTDEFTLGIFRGLLTALNFGVFAAISLGILIYFSFFDKSLKPENRRLAWVLLAANAVSGATSAALSEIMLAASGFLFSNTLFVAAYGYAAFRQMISERRFQRGNMQSRMTALILVVTIPVAAAMALFLIRIGQDQIEQDALARLTGASHTISDSTTAWLEANNRALENMLINDDIVSMQAERQKPLLENLVSSYPEFYLVSTTDSLGINVARSDEAEPKDYNDRHWYQKANDGAPITYQSLIGRTSGQPALVGSMPIYNDAGDILGVGMYASDLDEVSHLVEHVDLGEGGLAFVVDQNNKLLAHPDPNRTAELEDMSSTPAIEALRSGKAGLHAFTSQGGEKWYAFVHELDNGWGVVVQQPSSDLLAPVRTFQQIAFITVILGSSLLFLMAGFTIRQGIRPISALTETAEAIIGGDFSQTAPVDSEDELGLLARTFNTMTEQLRESISELELRVQERTIEVEQRALQLQVTAEVAREAAAIHDLENLLENTVNLISERFGFYHAGIFLLSGTGRKAASTSGARTRGFAVLRAASSEGGQRMLSRGHKLKVGQVGLVGYAAASGLPRIALDVGEDAVFFDNPDMPLTRSELALPLKVQDRVIGVLDVQSKEARAFGDEDIAILQILADQIALAIENVRLLEDSQQSLMELETLLGERVKQSWQQRLETQSLSFAWDVTGVRDMNKAQGLRDLETLTNPGVQVNSSEFGISDNSLEDNKILQVPIELRGHQLGSLILRRQEEHGPWTTEESEVIQQTIHQVALALENARLLEEIQSRSAREQTINRLTAGIARTLDPDRLLQSALSELSNLPDVVEASIFVGPPRHPNMDAPLTQKPGNGGQKI